MRKLLVHGGRADADQISDIVAPNQLSLSPGFELVVRQLLTALISRKALPRGPPADACREVVGQERSAGANSITKRPALSTTSVPKTAHALRNRLPIHAASSWSARRV